MPSAAAGLLVSVVISSDGAAQSTAVLEEVIVTATRVETNLQQTPLSVQAFTGEALELAGIDQGTDLGIMVPNAVFNPGGAGALLPAGAIRGLPGLGEYFDGFFMGGIGFLQRSFVELDRVEVLRGPQGTYFGRDSTGGAVQLITRPPAADFGVRFGVELGEFERRSVKLALDAPVNDRFMTKWTAASDRNDGFLDSQTAPFSLGDSDDSLLRGDILWRPTDAMSLRFTANSEQRRSSEARIVRISNTNNPAYIAYNVLAGNPNYLAEARAIDPGFPDPPFALAGDRFTPESHEPGYPGGTLGLWETRSNQRGPTMIADIDFATLTLDWDFAPNWSLEWLAFYGRGDSVQITDNDASEFAFGTGALQGRTETRTHELHVQGELFEQRMRALLGLWYSNADARARIHQWSFWEFAIPNTGPNPGGPGPPGTGGRPELNPQALAYVNAWGATVGNPVVAAFFPPTFATLDVSPRNDRRENAIFGEFGVALIDRWDLTLGFRFASSARGGESAYLPADAFRPTEPGAFAPGDPFALGPLLFVDELDDYGTTSSPRVSLSYRPSDTIYLYASYAEGFTSGQTLQHPFLPDPIVLDPEIVKTREIGMRSDLVRGRLRVNATLFDSDWDGIRVFRRLEVEDPNTGQPVSFSVNSSDGRGVADGFELELFYLPAERWEIDFALGLLDTEYLDIGDPDPNGSGLQPGIPFAYAPDKSYSLGLRYRLPFAGGDEVLFAANYGWMDEYQRSANNLEQPKYADGTDKPEPAYGILNARIVYAPANRDWRMSLFGTNLTDEWFVNGGSDMGFLAGFDRATIGRPRELGIGFEFEM